MSVINETAKRFIKSGAARFRWDTRATVLTLFAEEARISGFLAAGEWGVFQSTVSDRRVLPSYASAGTWARRTNMELVRFFGDRAGTYLDIGANIGLTTVPVAKNRRVHCIAFEPDPTNYHNLVDNVRRNAPESNVSLHQLAVIDRDEIVRLALSDAGNTGDHRVVDGTAFGRHTIAVRGVALDSALGEPSGPLAVKIDVQEAEPAVIAGAPRILAKAELAIMEFWPFGLRDKYVPVIEFLRGFSKIAAVQGEEDKPLVYRSAADACAYLEDFYKSAVDDEKQYLDVYARRARD